MRTLLALAVLALAGASARSATIDVSISGFRFGANNAVVEVNVGDTVRWTNNDGSPHTVTSGTPEAPDGKFDSGNVDNGQTFSRTFATAGDFPYFCGYHPSMVSGIRVKGTAKTVVIDVRNMRFGANNEAVTINQGDTVTWRNFDNMVHTVTSGARSQPNAGALFDHSFRGSPSTPATFSYTFTTAGTFPYFCRPHANMNASIIVNAVAQPKRGDVNNDNVVDSADVSAALRILGGMEPMGNSAMARLDIAPGTPDGKFTMDDVLRLARFVSGQDTTPL